MQDYRGTNPARPPFTARKPASWFWYGRFEAAAGGFIPPKGIIAGLLYRAGSIVGWIFGPPSGRYE